MATKRKPTIIKAPPPVPEAFIGHESATMMTEETFEEFEARMAREQPPEEAPFDGTGALPALDDEAPTSEAGTGALTGDEDTAAHEPGESFLPDEVPAGVGEAAGDDDDDYLPPEA